MKQQKKMPMAQAPQADHCPSTAETGGKIVCRLLLITLKLSKTMNNGNIPRMCVLTNHIRDLM